MKNFYFPFGNMSSSKKYDFTGKVALVTGSSSGIGAAIAIQLSSYGCNVAITGRSAAGLENVAQQVLKASGGVTPLQIIGDLLDDSFPQKLITETVAKYGKIDYLVNNAGGGSPKGDLSSDNLMEEFDNVLKLNLRSVVELTQRAVPYLEKSTGAIVNISSVAAIHPYGLVYSTSKAALDMVTKSCALELGPKLIRVNSVNPGPVVTAIARSLGSDAASSEAFFQSLAPSMLMKRVAQPEDIANLTSFLLSDDARNITGSIMVSDSGTLLKQPDFNPDEMRNKLKKK